RLPALEAGLAEEAARRSPLTLRLAGGGRFGGTVLWAGVEGDRAALGGLAAGVAEAVREAGLTVDDRPYTPHLTLALVRGGGSGRGAGRGSGRNGVNLRPLAEAMSGFGGRPWTAGRVDLMESRLGEGPGGGPGYRTVGAYRLGGPGGGGGAAETGE
ncbi:hypothetical protein BIV57_20515, partial [Mangrovactinospora gilvigrisea]